MKKYKKMAVVLMSVCIACIFLFIFHGKGNKENGIPKISFPERAGGNNYKFKVSNEIDAYRMKEIEENQELEQYYIVNGKENDEIIDNICKRFDVTKQKENKMNGAITYGEKNKLRIDENGCLEYYSLAQTELREVTLNDAECREMANKVIGDLGIDMEGYKYSGTIQGTGYNVDTPEDKIIISKEVVYTRNINNRDVYGNSKISVCFTDEGTVQSISIDSREIEKVQKTDEVISIDEALDKLGDFEGFIDVPDGTTKVVVEDVDIAYWEDSDIGNGNNTIQPVYEFTGIAYAGNKKLGQFTALESALN